MNFNIPPLEPTPLKFCKDCAHYGKMPGRSHQECNAAVNLVTGEPKHTDPYLMREDETQCGLYGKLFKQRETAK